MSANAQPSSLLPIVGLDDDRSHNLPQDATKWSKFRHHPVTQRLTHVLVSIVVGVIILFVINVTMVERNIKCATPEDCRKVRRLNTIVIGTRSIMNILVVLLLLFIILSQLGIDPRALIATAGVLGVVIGLGAQSFIKSFIMGLQIIISGKFALGDYVNFELQTGKTARGVVLDFSLQTTTVQDFSGARYFVSNGDILLVTNFSLNDQRAQVEVTVSHTTDIDTVSDHLRRLAIEMAADKELLDKVVRPPTVKGVTASGDNSYTMAMVAMVTPSTEFYVERYMRQRILSRLQSLGVKASASLAYIRKVREAENKLNKPEPMATTAPETVRGAGEPSSSDYPYTRARVPFIE